MAGRGRVTIRRLSTGEALATLQAPQPEQTSPETWTQHQNATLQMAFAPDGKSVALLGEWGMGVWRCEAK